MYSATSKTTAEVCKKLGFWFEVHFTETMKRGSKIYVRGTVGKDHEFRALEEACKKAGYIYKK